MPRRGRPPGRRPRPPRDRSCSTCGENHQGDGAGQLPGYFGHGNMGEMDGPEFYPDPATGRPNGPRWGRREIGGGRGTGPGGNTNENVNDHAWGVINDSGFEVWNDGQLVASGGDRLTRGGGRQGGEEFSFDDDDYSDDFDDFVGGHFGRGPPRGSRSGPFARGPRRGPGRLPPGMEFDDIPPWFLDEFDDGDSDDFDDFETMGSFAGGSFGRRGRGPRPGGRGGVRVTRQGGAIVVDNQFGGPPRGGGGRSGFDLGPDGDYEDDDDDEDEIMEGGFGGRHEDRVFRTRNGGTLRIHSGW